MDTTAYHLPITLQELRDLHMAVLDSRHCLGLLPLLDKLEYSIMAIEQAQSAKLPITTFNPSAGQVTAYTAQSAD